MKIAIVTDSLTNLRKEDLERYPHIYYVHLNVIVNNKAYVDLKEINNEQLFRFMDEGATCSTSQPTPEVFINIYEELLATYDHILGLHCTQKVSGTVNSARIASTMIESAENKITVVDTNTAAIGVENIVIKVCKMLEQGKTLPEILNVVEFYRHNGPMYLTIDDLTTLVRSGRISKASATIGNLLNIKPIIGLMDGNLDVVDKVRTKKRVLKWIANRLIQDVETSGKQIVRITHANALDTALELKRIMDKTCGNQVEVFVGNEIGSVMAIHFGRGGVGACWMPDNYMGVKKND